MNSEQLAWVYMLKNGSVNAKWDYYGSSFESNPKETEACLLDLIDNGIDWKKSTPPFDDSRQAFDGTDSIGIYIKTMQGTLVSNTSNVYNIACAFEEPMKAFEIASEMHQLKDVDSVEDAIRYFVLQLL